MVKHYKTIVTASTYERGSMTVAFEYEGEEIVKNLIIVKIIRVTVRDSFRRKHHSRKVTASNHQGMVKYYNYCDSEYC